MTECRFQLAAAKLFPSCFGGCLGAWNPTTARAPVQSPSHTINGMRILYQSIMNPIDCDSAEGMVLHTRAISKIVETMIDLKAMIIW